MDVKREQMKQLKCVTKYGGVTPMKCDTCGAIFLAKPEIIQDIWGRPIHRLWYCPMCGEDSRCNLNKISILRFKLIAWFRLITVGDKTLVFEKEEEDAVK